MTFNSIIDNGGLERALLCGRPVGRHTARRAAHAGGQLHPVRDGVENCRGDGQAAVHAVFARGRGRRRRHLHLRAAAFGFLQGAVGTPEDGLPDQGGPKAGRHHGRLHTVLLLGPQH